VPRFRLVAAALGAAMLAALPAAAGPLAPSKPSQLVTAWTVSAPCSNDVDGDDVMPNAFNVMRTIAGGEQAFAIPAKQALVITRAELHVGGADPSTRVAIYLLSVRGGAPSLLAETSAVSSATGDADVRIELPSGVAVRSGDEICVTGSSGGFLGTLNGFFAKDR
jgi:hypothetical protein